LPCKNKGFRSPFFAKNCTTARRPESSVKQAAKYLFSLPDIHLQGVSTTDIFKGPASFGFISFGYATEQ
jgi:hypothetical protein